MLSGMVFSTGVDFFLSFPGVADADADEEDEEADDDEDEELDDDSVSRGGMLSADSTVASPDAEEPPKRPLILPAGIEYEMDTDKNKYRRQHTRNALILDLSKHDSIGHRHKTGL